MNLHDDGGGATMRVEAGVYVYCVCVCVREQHQFTMSRHIANASCRHASKTRVTVDIIYLLALRAPKNRKTRKNEKKIIIDQATFSVAFFGSGICVRAVSDVGIQLQASLHTNMFRVLTLWRPNEGSDACRCHRRHCHQHRARHTNDEQPKRKWVQNDGSVWIWINHLCRGEEPCRCRHTTPTKTGKRRGEERRVKKRPTPANTKSHQCFRLPCSHDPSFKKRNAERWAVRPFLFLSSPSAASPPWRLLLFWILSNCTDCHLATAKAYASCAAPSVLHVIWHWRGGKMSQFGRNGMWCQRETNENNNIITISTISDDCSLFSVIYKHHRHRNR